jgi:hypothetical protein
MRITDRLGKVLYYVSCFAALQFAIAGALVALWSETPISAVGWALISFACLVCGWFMKYIFTELLAPVDRRAARTVRSDSALQPLRHLENELVKASKMPNLNG